MSKTLFSATTKSGEYYDSVIKASPEAIQTRRLRRPEDVYIPKLEKDSWDVHMAAAEAERTYDEYLYELYDKVGAFYRWSWNDFMDTELKVIQGLSKKIDSRMEDLDNNILNWDHLVFLLVLAKAFGGGKKT